MDKKLRRCGICGEEFSGTRADFRCTPCSIYRGDAKRRSAFVYGLIDPRDRLIRYVGASIDPRERVRKHTACQNNRHLNNDGLKRWIRGLRNEGLRPDLIILERIDWDSYGTRPEDISYKREFVWIRELELSGYPLLNIVGSSDS